MHNGLYVILILFSFGIIYAQEKSATSIEKLTTRLDNLGSVSGSISEYFTSEEIQLLQKYFKKNREAIDENFNSEIKSNLATTVYTTNASEFGSFEPPSGEVTIISNHPNYINAGVINPNNLNEAFVLDNNSNFYSIDISTGVYTSLGSIPGAWLGAEVNPVDGNIYALADDLNLYSIDTTTLTATLIGPTGLSGIPIALAIDGEGNAYTYDVVDDNLYAIDLNTGSASLIGSIGFDANFGQGMFWHTETNTIYMAAFNNTLFEAQLRSVNTTTGETTNLGVLGDFGSLSQYGWASSQVNVPGPNPALFQTWYLHRMDADVGDSEFIENIDPPITPYLTINNALEFNGVGACNSFSGIFEYNDDDFPLTLTPINFVSTNNDCGFQQHNDFEDWYFFQFSEGNPLYILDLDDTNFSFDVYPGFTFSFSNEMLSIKDNEINKMVVYPNPVSNQLFISSELYTIESITIYSALGRKIIEIENIEESIDVSQLSEGMYFVEVSTSEGKSVQKLIKK